ncbi:LuxR family two component transcriptional regulator [Sphaerotilus hippei]|uniref:LuxR family two component transcriptional regulator n=1 Tax=Sphaerotilus hippei TaxID=744406 RepID=A0A318GUW5_9BURK|nr:response regulator transcription factor [Sphaerotilus hippei]PXW92865.1 LuxR family two component transcriptional regulator [Sphaerotilus hippei]
MTTRPPDTEDTHRPAALDGSSALVLIVDDVPDNLAVLHDALDEAGYTVLVAIDGASALQRAAQARPDIILLDALMPGMDGFEVARRLKAEASTAAIPIVFMTGLTETEHVVAAFAAGGTDYVTKPIRAREVLARIAAHLHAARQQRQARNALDAFGHATLVVRLPDGRLVWQTALARQLLETHFASDGRQAPAALLDWMAGETRRLGAVEGVLAAPPSLVLEARERRLRFTLHEATGDGQWLLVLREADDVPVLEGLMLAFRLTQREAEVLFWVVKGKTNRDIGEILGSSPATVKKHLEHIYEKLGVETRNAAAAVALGKVAQLGR